jgi:hypothetical protein
MRIADFQLRIANFAIYLRPAFLPLKTDIDVNLAQIGNTQSTIANYSTVRPI